MSKQSINYKVGDWILEISTKLVYEIVDLNHRYNPPPIHNEHTVIYSDFAIKCISWTGHPREPIGINAAELQDTSILIKNKELAMVLYGRG